MFILYLKPGFWNIHRQEFVVYTPKSSSIQQLSNQSVYTSPDSPQIPHFPSPPQFHISLMICNHQKGLPTINPQYFSFIVYVISKSG